MSRRDFALLLRVDSDSTRRGIEAAIELVGGERVVGLDADSHATARGVILSLEGLAAAGASALEHLQGLPVFAFADSESSSDQLAAGLRLLSEFAGCDLTIGKRRSIRDYELGRASGMHPLCDLRLTEEYARVLAPLIPPRGSEILIGVERGAAVARVRGRADVVISTIPSSEDFAACPLKRAFRARRFAGVFPLLAFLRRTLGEAAWRPSRQRSAFIIDDPNLRAFRYGAMDYRRLASAAGEHGFHTAVAMIPLDWRKTSPRVAALIRQHPGALSLVVHGVEHVKREFNRQVDQAKAESIVCEGLRRMELHRRRTGVAYAPVMTFPHGPYNETWLAALRAAGIQAGTASSTRPAREEGQPAGRLHDMWPAEFVGCGFPIARRIAIGKQPREEFLFQAWLGKPLLIYTHPEYFRRGVGDLCDLADFINAQVKPEWSDLGSILDRNLLTRRLDGETWVNAYSNSIVVEDAWGGSRPRVMKAAPVMPEDESVWIAADSPRRETTEAGPATEAARVAAGTRVTFRPRALAGTERSARRLSLRSHARRSATELRDRLAGLRERPALGHKVEASKRV